MDSAAQTLPVSGGMQGAEGGGAKRVHSELREGEQRGQAEGGPVMRHIRLGEPRRQHGRIRPGQHKVEHTADPDRQGQTAHGHLWLALSLGGRSVSVEEPPAGSGQGETGHREGGEDERHSRVLHPEDDQESGEEHPPSRLEQCIGRHMARAPQTFGQPADHHPGPDAPADPLGRAETVLRREKPGADEASCTSDGHHHPRPAPEGVTDLVTKAVRRPRSERADDGPFPTAAKQGRTDRHPQDEKFGPTEGRIPQCPRHPHREHEAAEGPEHLQRKHHPASAQEAAPGSVESGGGGGSQDARLAGKWQPRQESNLDQTFRKRLFYPLNYGASQQRNSAHLEARKSPDSWGGAGPEPRVGGEAPWAGWAILDSNQ